MLWLAFFSLALATQLGYWSALWYGFRRAENAPSSKPGPLPPISVVVAARDEEANLPTLLRALARQTHSCYEVIVVDDASTDATAEIVRHWALEHTHFRLVQVTTPRTPRKKHALSQGIAAARHPLLALTDADCVPPPNWLARLALHHQCTDGSPGTILIGYSPYREESGLLNRLARYETFVTGFYTAAAAGLDRPYMAVGRNMSYPKSVFEQLGGFDHVLTSLSGDDDLFVQHAARHGIPVRPVLAPETFVLTDAPGSWTRWLRQKRRHASAGRFYARGPAFHLGLFHTTDLFMWLAPFFLGWAGAALLAGKLAVQGAALQRAATTLREQTLLPWFPLLAPLYTLYISVVEPLSLLRLPKRW